MKRLIRTLFALAVTLLVAVSFGLAQTATLGIQDQTLTGTNGTPMRYQIAATGASGYYVMGGTMPYGLTLDTATGLVTGTPTMSGKTTVQIKVTDTSGHSALGNLTVAISASSDPTAPTISNQSFNATVGTVFNGQIVATNANEYHVITGGMPSGLSLNTASGAVNGIPQTAGTTTVVLQVKDAAGTTASANITFAIAAGSTTTPPPTSGSGPTIKDQTLTGTNGTPVSYQIAASGATAYYVVGNLMPYGLQLNTATGLVTGTPYMSGNTSVQIKVVDGSGASALANLAVAITPSSDPTPPVVPDQSFSGTVGTVLNAQIQATNANAYSVVSGALPAGLSLNTASGAVNGIPQTAGSSTATIQVKNGAGTMATGNVTFSIAAAPATTPPTSTPPPTTPPPPTTSSDPNGPTIANQTINGTIDTPISARIAATNATAFNIIRNSMPPGLILNSSTGVITGSPTVAGTSWATVEVKNAAGSSASATVTFAVAGTNTQAVITNVSVDPGDHTSGVSLSVTYSRPVSVTLQPVIHLDIGGQPVVARFGYPDLSGGDRHVIHFSYPVQNGVQGSLAIHSPIDLTTGVIASDDGMPAALSFTPPDTSSVYVGAQPNVTKNAQTITFSAPPGGLTVGQPVTLNATSSAGLPITYTLQGGDATIKDGVLTPLSTDTVVVRAANEGNDTYYAAAAQVNFGNPRPAAEQTVVAGSTVQATTDKPLTLTTAAATASQPVTYTVVSGPATMNGDTVNFTGSGNVTVEAVTQVDATHSTTQTMTVAAHPVPRLINVSSRVHVGGAGDAATVGFVVTGTEPKQILIRAVGESLAAFGVTDGLANPTLTLYGANSTVVATNAGWNGDAQIAAAGSAVGAFALTPGKSDAALLVTLAPGLYTAQVNAKTAGSVLLEVYDVAAGAAVPTKQLINISTRAHIDANNQVLQGFVISGDEPKRVLIRAVGPALTTFGVTDAINDPAINVYSGGTVVASDDDWGTAGTSAAGVTLGSPSDIANAAAAVGAFALPAGSKDAAVLVTLPPGQYSAVVTGSAAQSGSVLVEAYEVP